MCFGPGTRFHCSRGYAKSVDLVVQIQKCRSSSSSNQFRNWPGAHFPTPLLLLLGIWVSVMGMMAESEIGLKRVVKLRQNKDTSHFQDFQKFND